MYKRSYLYIFASDSLLFQIEMSRKNKTGLKHLGIHQRLFNAEISFSSYSFIIKDNNLNYIPLESLLNLPFDYPYFNPSEISIKSYYNFVVDLSASIYFKSTFFVFHTSKS